MPNSLPFRIVAAAYLLFSTVPAWTQPPVLPATSEATINRPGAVGSGPLKQPQVFTYYVDPAGSDQHNGTSQAQAFATINRVNQLQQQGQLHCGQSIGFRRGGVWRETLQLTSSGCSGAPILFGAYGTGSQPAIDGSDLVVWSQGAGYPIPKNVWYTTQTSDPGFPSFAGVAGVAKPSVSSLTGQNQYYWDGSKFLYVFSTNDPSPFVEVPYRVNAVRSSGATYVSFQDLDLRGSLLYGFYCGTAKPCSNLTFQNMTFELNYANGFLVLSDNGVVDSQSTVADNTFRSNGGHGLQVGGDGPFMNWTIERNQIYGNCLVYSSSDNLHTWCGGIYLDTPRNQSGGTGRSLPTI